MPAFTRAPSLSLSDYLVQEISRKILAGELEPGERLHEAVIAEQAGISRGPVREAFRVLQEMGLVTLRPNRGAWVTEMTMKDIQETTDVRALLEGYAARLAAPRIAGEHQDALQTIVDRMERAVEGENAVEVVERDVDFHQYVANLAGNSQLAQLIASMGIRHRPHRAAGYILIRDPHLIAHVHQELLDALSSRDPDQAERAMRDHILAMGRRFIVELQERRR